MFHIEGTFSVKKSIEVITCLQSFHAGVAAFSADVTNCFFPIPRTEEFPKVCLCIEQNRVFAFESNAGISDDKLHYFVGTYLCLPPLREPIGHAHVTATMSTHVEYGSCVDRRRRRHFEDKCVGFERDGIELRGSGRVRRRVL